MQIEPDREGGWRIKPRTHAEQQLVAFICTALEKAYSRPPEPYDKPQGECLFWQGSSLQVQRWDAGVRIWTGDERESRALAALVHALELAYGERPTEAGKVSLPATAPRGPSDVPSTESEGPR